VAALIEAEVSDAAAAAREALRPKSALEARALLGEARAEVEAAGGTLQVLELAAKAQNGGWLAVCEARERLGLAQAVLAEAEADAEPLLELAAEASDAKAVASEPRAAAAATGRAIERVVADRCLSAGEAPLLQAAFPKDFQSLRQGPPPSAAGPPRQFSSLAGSGFSAMPRLPAARLLTSRAPLCRVLQAQITRGPGVLRRALAAPLWAMAAARK
ncbi:unnamed protein product, partial [Polarella glacialis]